MRDTESEGMASRRTLALLSLLRQQGQVSVREAARTLEMTPSTAQRILATLRDEGWAVQDEKRRYLLGPAALSTGISAEDAVYAAQFRPVLSALSSATGHTAHVLVLDGTLVRFVDGARGTATDSIPLRIGLLLPAAVTAAGRAMLTAQRHGSNHPTPVGVNRGETEPGIYALGISVGEHAGAWWSFAVALPAQCFSDDWKHSAARALMDAAEDARARMSGTETTLSTRVIA